MENKCAYLQRMVLWLEREAHLHGFDIEVEVAKILEKLKKEKTHD